MSDRPASTEPSPLDSLLAPLKAWIESREAERDQQASQAEESAQSLAGDIPYFVMRYP